jgi:hypothetical protein
MVARSIALQIFCNVTCAVGQISTRSPSSQPSSPRGKLRCGFFQLGASNSFAPRTSSFIALAGARERAGARRGVKATSASGLP